VLKLHPDFLACADLYSPKEVAGSMEKKGDSEEWGCHVPVLTPLNNQLKKAGVVVDDGLKAAFGSIGLFTGRRPFLVIAGSVLLTLLFAIGLVRFTVRDFISTCQRCLAGTLLLVLAIMTLLKSPMFAQ
jgi:hypothetical protein